MKYYAHGISDCRWLGDDFFNLRGEAITVDLLCLNNEWSTYLVENLDDKELLEKIVLQYLVECNKYVEGSIALSLFSSAFLKKHRLNEPNENEGELKKPFGLLHYNIRSKDKFLCVRCVLDVGKDLFTVFNNGEDESLLPIRFFNLPTIASIIKKYKEPFCTLVNGNSTKVSKMKSLFSSLKDEELNSCLDACIKKKKIK